MIDAQHIVSRIENSHDLVFLIKMEDYLETKLKIQSYNKGDTVYITKADFSDYTGWRRVSEGNLTQMTPEIERLAAFPGQITWEERVRDENPDDEDEEE
jgi:hypothetical protein